MSTNEKIETFAVEMLNTIYIRLDIFNVKYITSEFEVVSEFEWNSQPVSESCIEAVFWASNCRRILYSDTLENFIKISTDLFQRNISEFYTFFLDTIKAFVFPTYMNVFDKIFMSFALISEMCLSLTEIADKDIFFEAPFCWTIYFDTELYKEFISNGGWDELERHANKYKESRILNVPKNPLDCEMEHIDNLYEVAMSDYDESFLRSFIKELYSSIRKHQTVAYCLHCFPLFVVLQNIAFPEQDLETYSYIIEGYIQLFLLFLNAEEIINIQTKVRTYIDSTIGELDCLKQYKTNGKLIYDHPTCKYFERKQVTDAATLELLNRCFPKDVRISVYSNSAVEGNCLFCGRKTSEIFENNKLKTELKTIKRAVRKEAKYHHIVDNELSDIWKINCSDSKKRSVKSLADTCALGLNDKHVVRLFYVLGSDYGIRRTFENMKNTNLKATEHSVNKNDICNKAKRSIMQKLK